MTRDSPTVSDLPEEASRIAPSEQDGGTETAQALARLVSDRGAFPDEAARHLAELLQHSLAEPSAGGRREARLGLLIDLVSVGTGEFVRSERYEEERSQRRRHGEEWPAASSLSRAYGHWLSAVKAASRYWFEGGRARVASSHTHARPSDSYQPREIRNALLGAQTDLGMQSGTGGESGDGGSWPTEWEYLEWAQIKRRLARRAGTSCRLPSAKAIRKAYGTYERAVAATARAIG